MLIKKMSIEGLRGFSEKTCFQFSLPDGKNRGSGLTILVGPNNSGKSTVIEAVHILNSNSNSIPKKMRNAINDGKVNIVIESEIGDSYSINTTDNGGSFIKRYYNGEQVNEYSNYVNAFILSNKRNFSTIFSGNSEQSRENYKSNVGSDNYRNDSQINQNFGARLLKIYNGARNNFDSCLEKVISPIPKWTIESSDDNQMYLEFSFGKTCHSSQGAGDGYINIFNIIDSLYDSNDKEVILIDEPEVSLHPDLQRKLFNVLLDYSKNRQIIISTHSPYFIDWNVFVNCSKIIRLRKEKDKIFTYEIKNETKEKLKGLLNNNNNPHILSFATNEVFFLGDNIILTEGQEDVLGYKKIFDLNNYNPNASFFGWGMGGADNVEIILRMLYELGYNKIFTIFDNDRKEKIDNLKKEYPNYGFYAIPANDIRKKEKDNKVKKLLKEINLKSFDESVKHELLELVDQVFPEKEGLLDSLNSCKINEKYSYAINELITSIKDYFEEKNNSNKKIGERKNNKNDSNEEQLAQDILSKYLKENPLYKKIYDKYDYIKFTGGGGGLLSLKKISKNEFYAIVEEDYGISDKYKVTRQYHFIINIDYKKVKLRKEIRLNDTIPKKY